MSMQIIHSAQKQLQKLASDDAITLLHALTQYEKKQQGYIKWLENRPGYRIKIGKYRVIFEFNDQNDEIIILKLLTNTARH